MLDPRSPYSRRMWHYESDRPLSVAQLIALGSLDAPTAALLWLLIERHQSLIVSGPTDPTPGIGKTTTLNALLDFLPGGSTLVYTTGMYEDFSFKDAVQPAQTTVLANEVSNHLRIYMWGRVARELLELPKQGYAIATSCHADTIDDVLDMLLGDLRLTPETVAKLGVVVNIGIVGRVWPPRRRFLTVNLLRPMSAPVQSHLSSPSHSRAAGRSAVALVPLATWEAKTDAQRTAAPEALVEVAALLGMPDAEFRAAYDRRRICLEQLASGTGVSRRAFREAVEALQETEKSLQGPSARPGSVTDASDEDDFASDEDDDDVTRQKK